MFNHNTSFGINLHGLNLTFDAPDEPLRRRFKTVYGHLPPATATTEGVTITWRLIGAETAPLPPSTMPPLLEDKLIAYYQQEDTVAIRLSKYGLIKVDLVKQFLNGAVTPRCLSAYGVFEDVMMISLAPLYRQRGWFPLHAFAGVAPGGRAALLTGNIGAGKTTTGLALLNAGWKLLSNDSPLLTMQADKVDVLAYPGQLSAFDDSLARFEKLKPFIPANAPPQLAATDTNNLAARQKRVFRAEEAFTDPWATVAEAGGLFFPKIVPRLSHSRLVPYPAKTALLDLIPQAIESWDKQVIGETFALLKNLVQQAPCYILELAPDVENLPVLIESGLR